MLRTQPAGDEEFAACHIVPLAHQRVQDRLFTRLHIDVGQPGSQIKLAHGVAFHRRCLAHRDVILIVGAAAEAVVLQNPLPAHVHKIDGQIEVATFAGLAEEFNQRHLDFGVAWRARPLAGAEDRIDVVGEADRHIQQPPVACGAVIGHRRLEEMAGAVEFVAVIEVGPTPIRLHHIPV